MNSRNYEAIDNRNLDEIFGNHEPISEENVEERIERLLAFFGYTGERLSEVYGEDRQKAYNELLHDYFIRRDREDIG